MTTTCHRCGQPKRPYRFCRNCWLRERKRLGFGDDPRKLSAAPAPKPKPPGNTAAVYVNGEHIGNGTFHVTYPGSGQE